MRRIIIAVIVIVTLAIASIIVLRFVWQQRTARRIQITSPAGLGLLEKVSLGGADQWISIRAWDPTKPVLLLLHGGPGFPGMPFGHVTPELERHFVVVCWDQRGAGKSFSSSIPAPSMNMRQFVDDTLQLTELLRRRFDKPAIVIGAHSWGTMIATLAVSEKPERFAAYVAVCPAVNAPESERLEYQWALEQARAANSEEALAELTSLGLPPYERFADYNAMTKWIARYSAAQYAPVTRSRFIRLALESPLYSWKDLARIPLGAKSSFAQLWREAFYATDLVKQVPRIEVPVSFFLGRHDHTATASSAMAERYFNALSAPQGKQLIWFEDSGHWPHLEEPERFQQELVRVAADLRGK